ncbi:MAG TPA: hypothetical protein VMF03_12220 [Steroidobacteraceae bacterium]|nr:hypothetical protein [Steroidobacteraceae bacterium]
MGTIKARRQADGTVRYTAIVRKRVGKKIIHSEAKTFTLRSAALSWAKHAEVQLETHGLPRLRAPAPLALHALIRWYIETFETISKWQRSKQGTCSSWSDFLSPIRTSIPNRRHPVRDPRP